MTAIRVWGLLFSCFVLAALVGCSDDDDDATPKELNGFEPAFIEQWQQVTEVSEPIPEFVLQPACVPQVVPANDSVSLRGTIILVHGFTACNQQYFDWAEQLSALGFNVVLPALPGHGLSPDSGELVLESSNLPRNTQSYRDFAEQLVLLGELSPGPTKVIAGLSVGGAVAAMAAIEGQDVFDRALIMSPFLAIPETYSPETGSPLEPLTEAEEIELLSLLESGGPGDEELDALWTFLATKLDQFRVGTAQSLLALLKLTNFIPEFDFGWGEPCEAERAAGRAGICNFKVINLFAVDDFGRSVLSAYAQAESLAIDIQLIGVENDTGADPFAIDLLAQQILVLRGDQGSGFCLYEEGVVPHSFLSKYDNITLADEDADDVHLSALERMESLWLARFYFESANYLTSAAPEFFTSNEGLCERSAL
ncbi:alpha/beta hydrolase [Corallincola platygyrae]|uniref:Alpha/beta hydrolase n=1 Tax=Corallincola platygyrae TaxID=1193278 RepID=A0ABW4XSF9_9GAMM